MRITTPRMLVALPAALAAATLMAPMSIAATPAPSAATAVHAAPDATAQGIIMSDGRICDPIRHMGC